MRRISCYVSTMAAAWEGYFVLLCTKIMIRLSGAELHLSAWRWCSGMRNSGMRKRGSSSLDIGGAFPLLLATAFFGCDKAKIFRHFSEWCRWEAAACDPGIRAS